MTDLMDDRLAAAGRRWQAEQPPAPRVPLDRLGAPLPRRLSWRVVVAAAAAVVLVGGGAVVLTRALGDDSSIGPSHSSGSPTPQVHRASQVVPWRDLKARHPRIGHREHGRTVTPFDNVMADGHIHGHVHPGDVLTFTVYLESDTVVSLETCPDYTVVFGPADMHTWRLNCAQVPYQESSRATGRWHPVLPAGRRVRFEMRVKVPDELGRQKVLWTLAGPTTMPGFYGIVHVSRP
jgi:hypothetical protein